MPDKAVRTAGELEQALAGAGPDRPAARAALLNELAADVLPAQPARALELACEADRLSERAGDACLRAEALRLKAAACHRMGRFEDALRDVGESLRLFEAASDRAGCARSANVLGNVEVRLGRYADGLRHIHQAHDLFEACGNREGMAGCHNNLGSIQKLIGNYPSALEHYNRSLGLKREMGDDQGMANTMLNLGNIYVLLGKERDARETYEEALAIYCPNDDARGQSYCLNNLATLSHNAGDYSAAAEFYRKSLALARQVQDWEIVMAARLNLAHVTFKSGDAAGAEAELCAGLAEAEARDDPHHQITALQWLAEVCSDQGRTAEAVRHTGRALDLARGLQAQEQLMTLHKAMAGIAEKAGDHAAALSHYQEFHRCERELFSRESETKIEGIRVAAQVEQVKREKELLQAANEKLTRANAELEQLNRMIRKGEEYRSKLMGQVAAQSRQLELLAKRDGLTGLHNRRHLDEALAREFARARRYRQPLTVAMLDVDEFKRINDAVSHQAGDEALRAVAGILAAGCRTVDLAARYGGDEFVLAFPNTQAGAAAVVCERIRAAVETRRWGRIGRQLRVTVSIGLSDDLSLPNHEKLLAAADAMMYRAKQLGRNRVVWAGSGAAEPAVRPAARKTKKTKERY